MKMMMLATAAFAIAMSQPVQAAPADDALHAVTTWLDKFNAGDMNAFFTAHAPDAVLIDEFAPYVWSGKDAPKTWAEAFDKDAKAHAITEPHMDYAAPIRAESDGQAAYIVLPTVYRIKQNGQRMSAAGTMTFALTRVAGNWKIASWAYSAPAPAPDQ